MLSIGNYSFTATRAKRLRMRCQSVYRHAAARSLATPWLFAFGLFAMSPAATLAQAATTSTTLAVTPTPAGAYGSTFKMTATVSVVGVPAHALRGTVTFTDTTGGTAHVLGVAQVQSPSTFNNAKNQTTSIAVLQQSLGLIGTHSITAVFNASTYFGASSASAQAIKVTGTYPTSTSLVQTGGSAGSWSLTATIVGLGAPTLNPGQTIFLQDTSNGNYVVSSPNVPVNAGAIARKTVQGPNSPIGVGNSPKRVVTADFNGDGFPDLAVLNLNSPNGNPSVPSTITILLGSGSGSFTTFGTILAGADASALTTSDVNGDGIADLIVAVSSGIHLNVLLGNGDGTFTAKTQSGAAPPGLAPTAIAMGDFNGDGIPDIAATNMLAGSTAGQLFIYLGDGTGLFAATTTQALPVGQYPENIAVGDFNKDGNLDLVTANFTDSSITFLRGNGTGKNFSTSTINLAANSSPYGIVAADFNGDGNLDIAVTQTNTATLAVMIGDGNGGFGAAATFPTGTTPSLVVAGDFNGDGIIDLAVSNYNGANVTFFQGTGSGSFQTPGQTVTIPGSVGASSPLGLATADFDGDGNGDLAVTNSQNANATVTILLNQITDTSTAAFNLINVPGSGNHLIDAVYGGDTNFLGSTSNSVSLAASPIGTTSLLSSSNANPTPGQQVVLTASISPKQVGNLSPATSDTMTFFDGTTALGTATLSGGVATFNTSFTTNGTHNLTAVFSGDANFVTSTSSVVPVTVGAVAATVITWATPASIAYGTALSATQLNATATSGGSSIPGNYTYSPAAGTLLTAGTQTLSVTFVPTSNTYSTASKSVTIQVTQASPVITWANPVPITYGTPLDSIQLNAIATTTGTVAIPLSAYYNVYGEYDDGKTFTTGGFDGNGNAYSTTGLGSSVTWNGVVYTLGPADGLMAVSNQPKPITVPSGTYTTLQLLGGMVNNQGYQYQFTVNYIDGTSAVTTLNMSDWVYPQSFAGESVVKCNIFRNSATGISDGHSTCVYGYSIPLDTTRVVQSVLVPQSRNAVFLAMALTTAPIPGSFVYTPAAGTELSTGAQTLKTVFTPTDTRNYTASTATVPLTVNQATTTLTWAQPSPIQYGTPLSSTQLNAVPTVNLGMVIPPTFAADRESAIFSDGQAFSVNGFGNTSSAYSANLLGSSIVWSGTTFQLSPANLPNALSSETVALPQLSFNSLYLLGAGTTNYTNQTFVINYTDGSSTTSLLNISGWTSPQNYAGESIAATNAYLNTSTGTRLNATNYVYGYQIALNPAKTLQSVVLPNNQNVAFLAMALSTTATPAITVPGVTTYNPPAGTILPLGTNPLAASFTPTDTLNYSKATAKTTILVVQDMGELITLTSNNNPALPGTPVVFTATLPAGATGTVTFFDNGVRINSGTVATSNGAASASVTTSTLTNGTHAITATYSGDTNYGSVTSSTLSEYIGRGTATVVPKGVPNPSAYTQSVIITVTVTGISNVAPTGTVQLTYLGNPVGPSLILSPGSSNISTATYTTTVLPAGSDNIIATYSGDANYF